MAKRMRLRVYGPEIKKAVLAWVKQHLTSAKDIIVMSNMVLDSLDREIGDDQQSWISVEFDSEKEA
jgi:hypothetical protein